MVANIEQVIRERQISRLVHFTRLVNVPSILHKGLVPRSAIHCEAPACVTNDAYRYDGRTDANCLSITFPNSRMFYAYQQQDPSVEWAILILTPRLLLEKEVLFCRHNAADRRISELPDHGLQGAAAFRLLFDEIEEFETRDAQHLKLPDPTDVQAELLVRGTIEPNYIDGVVFRNKDSLEVHKPIIGDKAGYLSDKRGLYGDRKFYRTWGRGK